MTTKKQSKKQLADMERVAVWAAWNAATGQNADPFDCCMTLSEALADLRRLGVICAI